MTDGLLNQNAWVDDVNEYLSHHGVKGMHWGVRKESSDEEEGKSGGSTKSSKDDKREAEAKKHEDLTVEFGKHALMYQKEHEEVLSRGFTSAAAKRVYGDDGTKLSSKQFYAKYHQTKGQALDELTNNLRHISNRFTQAANHHADKALKIRTKINHGDLDDAIEHFGVKGMHWGVRRERGSDGQLREGSSEDHTRTQAIRAKVSEHGVKSLSNDELQHLLTRLDLENRHSKLNPAEVSAGRRALDEILSESGDVGRQVAKQFAKQYAVKGIESLIANAGK